MHLLRHLAALLLAVLPISPVLAYHHVIQTTVVEKDSCTAEAVGPHALLTASHCELGTDQVVVDGTSYVIAQRLRDGLDHTIYILPAADFTSYLQFANRAPSKGERVRGWGWPGNREDAAYHEGTVEKEVKDDSGTSAWLFNFPIQPGDSGGAILDDTGKILSVVSLGDAAGDCLGFPMAFSEAQLALTR